jgi:hypothetical protein
MDKIIRVEVWRIRQPVSLYHGQCMDQPCFAETRLGPKNKPCGTPHPITVERDMKLSRWMRYVYGLTGSMTANRAPCPSNLTTTANVPTGSGGRLDGVKCRKKTPRGPVQQGHQTKINRS